MTLRSRSFDNASALEEAVSDLLRRFDGLTDPAAAAGAAAVTGVSGEPAYYVAASDASNESKAVAHFLCDGTADEVEINAAINALPVSTFLGGFSPVRGSVILSEGRFDITSTITVISGVTLKGQGRGTALIDDGTNVLHIVLEDEAEICELTIAEITGL